MRTFTTVAALLLVTTGGAQADLIIHLDQATLGSTQGETLVFKGIISNTGADQVFLNRDSLNLAGIGFTFTDLFLLNVPISLLGGQSSVDIELFAVNIFEGPAGINYGSYTLFGGGDGTAQDRLAT